ncbi:MAG: N-acetyltransferase [Actinobacteria bacterium]|nr:N-acetyltransferase [Actinomycetota bacterium]
MSSTGERKEEYLDTPRGRVRIRTHAHPEFIAALRLDEGMGIFAAPHYPPSREKKALERLASNPESDIIVAYTDEGVIVGFVAIAPPSSAERWGRLSGKGLLEAMAIEVSRNWRSMGIADKMLECAVKDDFFADKIVICTGYSWHWDLESTGLSKEEYRRMLLRYLEKAGFLYYDTDEPNVNLDAANFFTAYIGPGVSEDLHQEFERLLFKDPDWAEFRGRPPTIAEVLGKNGLLPGGSVPGEGEAP